MVYISNYSLLQSTLTVERIIGISKEKGYSHAIIADNNLAAALHFFKEAKTNNITPVISTETNIDGAIFWIIALNGYGFKEMHSKSIDFLNASEHVVTVLVGFDKPSDLNSPQVRDVNMVGDIRDNLTSQVLAFFAKKYKKEKIVYKPYTMESDQSYRTLEAMYAIKKSVQPKNVTIQMVTGKNPIMTLGDIENFDTFNKNTENKPLLDIISKVTLEGFEFGEIRPPHFTFLEESAREYNLPLPVTEDEFLLLLCKDGLKKKNLLDAEGYLERLTFELKVISEMKFPGYMLLVWDFMAIAHKLNIPVGPGRGSAAGSLVAYALNITDIDPIPYDLLFERFLNPERKTMPDIDMDFCKEGRQELIDAVTKKYGQEHVAQIITFMNMGAKGALKTAARATSLNHHIAENITKMFPDVPNISLKDTLEQVGKPLEDLLLDPAINRAWNYALKLEGHKKNLGVHAAGLVIADKPIKEYAPITKVNGAQVVQFEGGLLEDVNLIKFDFLGLETLTVIRDTIALIKKNHGVEVSFDEKYENKKAYDLIKKGLNGGLFQIESKGMIDLCTKTQPNKFEDIVALLALYRPGPIESGMLDDFVKRIRGEAEVTYFGEFSDLLKPILEPTYGVIVYQEQIMQIVQEIGGFSLGEADVIRRAMGKKDIKYMKQKAEEFATGAQKKGFTKEGAISLFEKIELFAGYGFNKSHSAAYAVITYRTAYLKANYPAEFLTALLNINAGDHDKLPRYISEAKNLGIRVNKINLDTSTEYFETDGKDITYSLRSLKSVGSGATAFIKARLDQTFTSIEDFMIRIKAEKVKKSVFTSFVKVGLLDHFGFSRKSIIENDTMIFNLKEGWMDVLSKTDEYSPEEKLALEKNIAGLYITDPFENKKYASFLEKYNMPNLKDLPIGESFVLVYPEDLVVRTAKKTGKNFGIFTGYYGSNSIELGVFDKNFETLKEISMDTPLILEVSIKEDGRTSIKRILSASKDFKNCFSLK